MIKPSPKIISDLVTNKAVALINRRFNPAIGAKEFSGGWLPERCDAILFTKFSCYLIETKISRSDFLAEKRKPHRQEGKGLIGNYRYYACPTGLIKPEELPPKWGLIYVDTNKPQAKAIMVAGYGYESNRDKYRFDDTGYEKRYLYALATRYKTQKFMDNIL